MRVSWPSRVADDLDHLAAAAAIRAGLVIDASAGDFFSVSTGGMVVTWSLHRA
jgi:hypothetical protein